ncbi:OmpA/MotB family protein [Hyphomicrobium nitrativorans NL23]|uniref:OmpA/MotB family protein n=1 Tax=Hyphomicrobium nitrativorans NL23 TaxID=1029756 RepID=V5SEN5_9HYPH|nr:OmpA family protein [Hyphomicrobium nitrativorans]AHB48419.1 OmpA/MotB family protein [Hyphomicrobium nitrativorans NL23]
MTAGNASTFRVAAVTPISRCLVLASVVTIGCGLVQGAASAQELGLAPDDKASSAFGLGAPGSGHRGFSIVEPPDGLSDTRRGNADEGSGRWFFRSWRSVSPADSAQSRFDEAKKALDGGKTAEAQRLFEALIGDAPNSKLASEARQHLGRIYSEKATSGGSDVNVTAGPDAETLPWGAAQEAEAASTSFSQPPAVPRSVLLEARVSRVVDEAFLADAGDRVFFSSGSAELGMRAQGVIRAQARFLMQRPALSAVVEGHADDGALSEDELVKLSGARAQAVRDQLVAEGVAEDRLAVFGRGVEERVADCPAAECMAQNRRAITILLDGPRRLGHTPARQARQGAPHSADVPASQ